MSGGYLEPVSRLEFDAVVEATPGGGGGAYVALPAHAAEVFRSRARLPVKATFNGVPYRGSTMPMGDGTFALGITKAIRSEAGADIGQAVHVVVEQDEEERHVEVPPALRDALTAAGLRERFDAMSYSHRREYVRWITEAKREATRHSRVEKAVAMIAAAETR